MSYTVLARRYRSQTFDDVVGQEAAARTLKNAIATDRVAHAYLFTGTRGVGKTTMARILAKALNCLSSDQPTPAPCGRCESCLAIHEGEDIDVLEIDGASNTGVEHIRELRQNAIYRPARARFKIYIIDEVHMLSVSAFNALLKTLEEPPEHVKFILATTEPNKVPATIQSRCQRFDFRNIPADRIAQQLSAILETEKIPAEPALLRRIARLANGSMRDALSLLDQLLSMAEDRLTVELLGELLGTPRDQQIAELVDAIAAGDLSKVLGRTDVVLQEGLATEPLAQALQDYFRDLLVLKVCPADTELVEQDDAAQRETLSRQAQRFDEAALVYYITVMEQLRHSLKSGDGGRPLLEAALVRLAASERFSDTRALLELIESWQAASSAPPGSPAGPSGQAAGRSVTAAGRPAANTDNRTSDSTAGDKRTTKTAEAAATTAAGTGAATFDLPKTITLDFLRKNWPKIVAEIARREEGRHLEGYLQAARPLAWKEQNLELGFGQNEGIGRFLADHSLTVQEMQTALCRVLRQPVTIQIAATGDSSAPSPPAAPAVKPAKRRRSPGDKPSQQQINAAMADPQVRQIQQHLGGRVRQIGWVETDDSGDNQAEPESPTEPEVAESESVESDDELA
ncbi:MAG: DNA polymerase III subunit gamma/tau [Sedimentisphaerales bacterium]|nr:DNA polymerase III subunit gamma/tau [Sedimentisphaerales bacterium]